MENSTVVNGTRIVQDNMPVQPETIITIIAIFFFIALTIGLGLWLWTKFV